jgi:hypothetical protein
MRILINAGDLRKAEILAQLLYLKAWGYISEASDLYGRAGFIVIRETDTYLQHRDHHDIQGVLDNRMAAGDMAMWQISLDWLMRSR